MNKGSRRDTKRVEAALWLIMGTLAFLVRDNPHLIYPLAFYLFLGLLGSSLRTNLTVRLAPRQTWLHAATILAGLGAVAAIQQWSGGPDSNLWTLYLLPLFTAAVLLEGRELAWTAVGACLANALMYADRGEAWNAEATFELVLKTGVLASAAGACWLLSLSERDAERRAERQRREIGRLEAEARRDARARESDKGLARIAADGAGAAHDLSTPLMVVRAYARLHLERGSIDADLARDLERIDSAAAFCQNLVAGLLARAGGPPVPKRISSVLETALFLAEPILREKKITLDRETLLEPMTVLVPEQDLERVLLNLLGNAAKILPPGGRVRVRTLRREGESPAALICVEDDGPGIPAELLPRLFQPFATTRKAEGGTGLGLHLSREAVRRAGGELTAENRPEGGARFTIRLPLTFPAREAEASPSLTAPRTA